ncbi:MAG: hypothetical protein JWM96_1192, partial [Alphaproteobacteria bacterium]|nr:hypothetical protein [Alphaproteobacteria bacterium]
MITTSTRNLMLTIGMFALFAIAL